MNNVRKERKPSDKYLYAHFHENDGWVESAKKEWRWNPYLCEWYRVEDMERVRFANRAFGNG